MVFLITGSNGLLGQKILKNLVDQNSKVIATSKGKNRNKDSNHYTYESLDITNEKEVSQVLNLHQPDVVFNTAAMTNVDLCEDERVLCDKLNVDAVGFLANLCLEIDAHLIHISTDFIFDGEDGPYSEKDIPNPLSYYGKSKYKSEKLLNNHLCKSSILRTIVLFGVAENLTKSNIVLWVKDQLENLNKINIIDDEFRAPTLAEDLAEACVLVAKKKAFGIFHICGKDLMSIYDMVVVIANFYNFDVRLINRISTKTLNQKAKRPPKTGFILDKAINKLGYNPHSFEECLIIIDEQLKNNN
jgi:dTDP-4-dehydrorhamnose reductase|tara:strand:+ start:6313 stop:7215 length:903 start_codon:yes stop_codon:yes gene_type:complete